MQIHIVEKGDTLWKISRSYGVSFEELKRLNAHLANPEYIVPGMKIFIPDTKSMESVNHPYSENRPVKKEMVKKEEMKPHPVPPKAHQVPPKAQQIPPKAQHVPPKAQPVPPKAQQVPPKAQPVQPVPIAPPPAPPVRPQPMPSYSLPYHMMPVPDLDMTPSPQGWRLVESTSIHIQANFTEREKPAPPPPAPPVQQQTQPIAQEPSPVFEEMYPCPPEQDFSYMYQCMYPQMHPGMHPHMQAHFGGCPCVQICYVPVYPCPPYHHHHHF
ncbi:LysM peptidoglycan-binding domain-containing protein [Psychrobacillus lasiicapitis]|uniref:LysM peptidoglycan-binding domain-containing protein n=1 Tax=Psychrobacillus lasiicapitis TaxID=1636719 RepID=UPI00166E1FBD|nr:LysM domain-containing protein [Psychrobacillus lasiicapitis]GGA35418.1 hypothetical protein GCM10011384_26430 [Psychrobacillus lasiicapitis]